ncbi:MAG: AI-2E family transporter [Alphaproteobacteria bacterium]|nr:AI-2E family transporter [Alphaproteobacteria bacterium]
MTPDASPSPPTRLERILAGTLLAGLAIGCLLVLRPFVAAILWAAILVFATWPVFSWLAERLAVRRWIAALVMILLAFLLMVAPLTLVVADFADDARRLVTAGRQLIEAGLPDPPAWLAGIPIVGAMLDAEWRRIGTDTAELQAVIAPYAQVLGRWGFDAGVNVGLGLAQGVLELALALFIAFFLYRDGDKVAGRVQGAAVRLLGARGDRLFKVASNTVQAVVYGVVGTALIQGLLMLIGLTIAGVPNTLLLAFLTGVTSPLPVGPPFIWLGAAAWLYATKGLGWAVFMIVWGAGLVSMADNVVRPLLISRGGTTPIVITLLGIIGGVFAFGFLGLFLGPTLLAVGYTLLNEWTTPRAAGAAES